jgi:hypothetical protein
MSKIPLRQQIAAVRLEIEQRKLSRGKMTVAERDYHVARLDASAATLEWLQANEERIKEALGNAQG